MTIPMITTSESSTDASATDIAIRRLRTTLGINASTSALGGLVAAAIPAFTAELLGTDREGWVRLVGCALVVFAAAVALTARSHHHRLLRLAPFIVVADAGWVAATITTIASGWFSPEGSAVMAVVGLAVGAFAILQHVSASRAGRALSRR